MERLRISQLMSYFRVLRTVPSRFMTDTAHLAVAWEFTTFSFSLSLVTVFTLFGRNLIFVSRESNERRHTSVKRERGSAIGSIPVRYIMIALVRR